MKLISMMDYIDFIQDNRKIDVLKPEAMLNLIKYKNFLKQPLELWMFVPCDKDGNVLNDYPVTNEDEQYDHFLYEQAKERCLFDGFVYLNKERLEEFSIIKNDSISFNYDDKYKTFEIGRFYFKTIEDLTVFNLNKKNK